MLLERNPCWRETMKLIYKKHTNSVKYAQTKINIRLDEASDLMERIGPFWLLYAIRAKPAGTGLS